MPNIEKLNGSGVITPVLTSTARTLPPPKSATSTLDPTTTGTFWSVYMRFGSGNDTLTLTSGDAGFITGSIDGGGGANVFNQNDWTIVPPWSSNNF